MANHLILISCCIQVSAHTAKRKLAEFSSCGDKFLSKYDELRQRQTRDLNPLVFLLSKITEDAQLCAFLREARPPTTGHAPKEITDVKVLDLVEGQEVALPERGMYSRVSQKVYIQTHTT